MRPTARCLALLGSALLLLPPAAAAQMPSAPAPRREPILSLGLGGGMTIPTGRAGDAYKSGLAGQAFVLVHLPHLPALRFALGLQKYDFKNATGLPGASSRILSGIGGLNIDLLHGPVRPYLTAGLGAFDVRTTTDTTAGAPATSTMHFGVDAGAGLALRFGRIGAFVEGKVQNVYSSGQGFVNAKSIRAIPVSFGILVGL